MPGGKVSNASDFETTNGVGVRRSSVGCCLQVVAHQKDGYVVNISNAYRGRIEGTKPSKYLVDDVSLSADEVTVAGLFNKTG